MAEGTTTERRSNVIGCTADGEMRMLAPDLLGQESKQQNGQLPQSVLPAELEFYESHAWCLNPHPTVREATAHLRDEIDRRASVPRGWQCGEVVTNVFLLSCGLLNSLDESLRGPGLRLPWRLAGMPLGRGARWVADNVVDRLRPWSRAAGRRWRNGRLARPHDLFV